MNYPAASCGEKPLRDFMKERKPRQPNPTKMYLLHLVLSSSRKEPHEWGPYRPMQPREQVNPEHIVVGKDGVARVPLRIYKINGDKPIIGPETR